MNESPHSIFPVLLCSWQLERKPVGVHVYECGCVCMYLCICMNRIRNLIYFPIFKNLDLEKHTAHTVFGKIYSAHLMREKSIFEMLLNFEHNHFSRSTYNLSVQ